MKYFNFILILILCIKFSFSQDTPPGEYLIDNIAGYNIKFKIYPVSMVFNGNFKNDLSAMNPGSNTFATWNFIAGTNTDSIWFGLINNKGIGFNHDYHDGWNGEYAAVGYGRYKIEIFKYIYDEWTMTDTIYVEWDYDFNNLTGKDFHIFVENVNNLPKFTYYRWTNCSGNQNIPTDKIIKSWEACPEKVRQKNMGPAGGFIYDGSNNMPFPQDSRRDCQTSENDERHCYDSELGCLITNYLSIKTNVSTISDFIHDPDSTGCWAGNGGEGFSYFNRFVTIDNSAKISVYPGYSFTLSPYSNYTNAVKFTIKSGGLLRLLCSTNNGSNFTVNQNSTLTLENGSQLWIQGNSFVKSELRVKPDGVLCNYGANIYGSGNLIIERGANYARCEGTGDFYLYDSLQFILEDSSLFVMPPNKNLILEGLSTRLILKQNSKIMFGAGSKLILRDGARLIANNATFTYLDSTDKTWDGIYLDTSTPLSEPANDTITNCTIENAVNGINIINKTSVSENPNYSTQIIGCTFRNTTSSTSLNYGINIENSDNILIKDCDFYGSTSAVFSNAVNMSYCPDRNVNIIGNEINNSVNGIISTGSSPYIAFNTFNGSTSGYGIYMDNSNGKIKYNNITGYGRSVYLRSSSPYVFSNTLSNANTYSIDLNLSSVPVLNPLVSDVLVYYLGGANTFSGSPSSSYIYFTEDAYPLLQNGINNFDDDVQYFMSGAVPMSIYYQILPAEYNYWAVTPDPGMFNLSEGSIDAEPYNNNPELLVIDGTDICSIGFGLYDTIYYQNLALDQTAEGLFIQAYRKEMTGEYSDAVSLYKQIIQNHKNDPITPKAISGIFSVLEKAVNTNYSQYETYFSNLKNNAHFPKQIRELAEDFMIKTKVRRNMLQNAINDYTAIYNQNPNSPKGQHALHNKTVLEAMQDTTGEGTYSYNPLFVNNDNNTETELFRLYQNYPNPFNPVTVIKYRIPVSGNIEFKVYDLQGRELYNFSGYKQAGEYEYEFDGSRLSSGVYFYQLKIGDNIMTKKMLLIK